jgi:hypothetical protein
VGSVEEYTYKITKNLKTRRGKNSCKNEPEFILRLTIQLKGFGTLYSENGLEGYYDKLSLVDSNDFFFPTVYDDVDRLEHMSEYASLYGLDALISLCVGNEMLRYFDYLADKECLKKCAEIFVQNERRVVIN